jgi:hypothetical protein
MHSMYNGTTARQLDANEGTREGRTFTSVGLHHREQTVRTDVARREVEGLHGDTG